MADHSSMSPEANSDLENDFPSIAVGYSLALTSFEMALKRLDAIDSKNQQLTSFCLAAFVLIPSIGNATRAPFRSGVFFISLAFLALTALLSIIAAKQGKINLI